MQIRAPWLYAKYKKHNGQHFGTVKSNYEVIYMENQNSD